MRLKTYGMLYTEFVVQKNMPSTRHELNNSSLQEYVDTSFNQVVNIIKIYCMYMSWYALESPVPPADLIAPSPGYRVPLDLATIPYVPQHTWFALTEAATSFQMFEMMLPAP